jgi:hypothetical protein
MPCLLLRAAVLLAGLPCGRAACVPCACVEVAAPRRVSAKRASAAGEKTSAAGEKESTRRTEERRQSASARTEQDTSFRILPSFLREAFFLLFLVGFGPCCLRLGLWLKAH